MEFNRINWNSKGYEELIEYLKENSDEKYKRFNESLVPGENKILGIQIPKLRAIAKEISKGNYKEYLNICKHNYHEEIMLQGLLIGCLQEDYLTTLKLIESFIPHISNWAICDSFCKKFNSVNENKKEFLEFLNECIKTDKEYYIRFAVVMIKVMYVDEEYIDISLDILNNISHEGYYVKMAVAWTLCDCFIKFENKTMKYLSLNKLDKFTHNKTLQKIVESNRVEIKTKNLIREMKIK